MRTQSEAQKQHRDQFKKWMGRDNAIAMKRKHGDWLRDHQDKLRHLEMDMFEMKPGGLKVLG